MSKPEITIVDFVELLGHKFDFLDQCVEIHPQNDESFVGANHFVLKLNIVQIRNKV